MTERSILITGCSSGIGLAAAEQLKARGWRVFATARTEADLERLRSVVGVTALQLDLRDAQSIANCADAALRLTGGDLFAVFNNGAFGQPGAVEDLRPEVLRDQIEVNVIGTHDLTRRLIPAMRKAGRGRIVQCSSVLGLVAAPWRGAYCASKFALEGLTDAMRLELKGSGIEVSLIEPGPIRTRFVENALAAAKANIDLEHSVHRAKYATMIAGLSAGGKQTFKLEPDAVVKRLIHALDSRRPKPRYFVTTPTFAAAALKRILPVRAMDWIAAKG